MKRNALLTGGFVLAALALIVAAIVTVGGADLFSKRLKAVVYFDGGVRGLYVGAPVTFRGVKIGEVESIGIEVNSSTLQARIPVRLALGTDTLRMSGNDVERLSDLPDLVRRGLRARLILQSFVTGQAGIDLDFKPQEPLTLLGGGQGDVPEIPAMRDRLDALIEQVSDVPISDLVADLRTTIKTLDQTLKTTQKAVELASKDLSAAAVQAKQTLAVGAHALQDVQAQAGTALASIEQLSDTSRDVVLKLQPDLQSTLASTREAAEAAEQAMNNLSELSAPGASLRSDLELAVRDLSLASRSLRSFSEQLRREPNSLIFGK